MQTIFINGKFTAQRMTGVQRMAAGLVHALDHLLYKSRSSARWILLCPPGGRLPQLKAIEVREIGSGQSGLHAWEQLILPLYTAGRLLLNLSGPAPLFKRRQVCMIPDAAIFDHPSAYTSAYGIWYRLLFRTISRTAAGILTISQFSKSRLVDAIGPHATRLQIVHCSAAHITTVKPNDGILTRLDLTNVSFLLAVGSLNPTKNLPSLIQAFAAVSDPAVRLVLVGGSNSAVFAGQGSFGPTDPRVVTSGAISDAELASLYSHATAFVFPSFYEGFGIPPLEAMSLGCPVVAARAASIPEICTDAAHYFDPSSIPGISAALTEILTDSVLRDRLRERGVCRALNFTWERSAYQLLDHLVENRLISGHTVIPPS